MVNMGHIIDKLYGMDDIGDVPRPALVTKAIPKERKNTPGIIKRYLIIKDFEVIYIIGQNFL